MKGAGVILKLWLESDGLGNKCKTCPFFSKKNQLPISFLCSID